MPVISYAVLMSFTPGPNNNSASLLGPKQGRDLDFRWVLLTVPADIPSTAREPGRGECCFDSLPPNPRDFSPVFHPFVASKSYLCPPKTAKG